MNLKQAHNDFWRDGFLHLKGFFDVALMDELDGLITDHFGVNPDFWHNDEFLSKSQTEVIPWFPQNEGVAAFDKVDQYQNFNDITEALIGKKWNNLYSMTMFSKKGTVGQAWHQDCPSDDPALHNLNRLVYTHSIQDSVGGQLVVVPGSHKMGVLPKGDPHADMDGQLVIKPQKGDLLFVHGHTYHRVMPIIDKYRFSTNFRAAPQGIPEDITNICVYRNMRYQFSTNEVVEDRLAT